MRRIYFREKYSQRTYFCELVSKMWTLTSKTSEKKLIWQTPFSLYIFVFFTENRWFDLPWDFHLINSESLVFTKFEIHKDTIFLWYLIWRVFKPLNSYFQLLIYNTFRHFLHGDNQYFTHWVVLPYAGKEPLSLFFSFL